MFLASRSDSGLLPYPTHDFCDDRLAQYIRKAETVAICHNLNGFSGAVDNHAAAFALMKMLLQSGSETRLCRMLEVIAEFSQELCAAKHVASPGA
jgi:hypothetical protein